MRVDALLADYAQVHGNKLFVSGAGINLIGTPPVEPYRISLALAFEITVPWQATNQLHTLKVSMLDADSKLVSLGQHPEGEAVAPEDMGAILAKFNVGRSPQMKVGESSLVPGGFNFFGLEVPQPGGYSVVIEVDGTEMVRKEFRVAVLQAGPPTMPTI